MFGRAISIEAVASGERTASPRGSLDFAGLGVHLDIGATSHPRTEAGAGALIVVPPEDAFTPISPGTPVSFDTPSSGRNGFLSPSWSPAGTGKVKLTLPTISFPLLGPSALPESIRIDHGEFLQRYANDRESREEQLSRTYGSYSLSETCTPEGSLPTLSPLKPCLETLGPQSPASIESVDLQPYLHTYSGPGSCLPVDIFLSLCGLAWEQLGKTASSLLEPALCQASKQFGELLKNQDDQALSALNLILGIWCADKNGALAAEMLKRMRKVARDVGAEDAIVQSITFMISMAENEPESCPVDSRGLHRIAKNMTTRYGSDHKHSIVARYNLAWRLAMDAETRGEAMQIVSPLLTDARRQFLPNHMQVIAILMVLARLHRYQHDDNTAAFHSTMALKGVEMWRLSKDYPNPYHQAIKKRQKTFLKIRPSVTVR